MLKLVFPETHRSLLARSAALLLAALALLTLASPASADALAAGAAAFNREDYVRAAAIFTPLAEVEKEARAQAYLGFMYQNGRGVPQSYEEGARFYRASAEQGFPPAQYMLGLMYDKGQGVPQDYVLAYMWVTLGVAGASPKERPAWTRIRDAIASKMSLAQRSLGQRLALNKPTLRVPNSWPW
ncbi:MAG: sel1 repeat family protein [Methylobacteriaceae bacterium]|nr:sel1 repeat family protein [Methylobacteriaceae bacterium]